MDYARAGARWLLGATAHPGGQALTDHLLDRLALPAWALVADVACGDGATLRRLADRGLLAVGVDVEPRAVTRAGRAVVGDVHALPLAGGAYDAVVCECAVSTFADPARALAQLARLLRPGGALAVTTCWRCAGGWPAASRWSVRCGPPRRPAPAPGRSRRAPCRTGW